MKIEVDLINEPSSYELQLEIIAQYIKNNTESIENYNCWGELTKTNDVTFFSIPKIKETNKNEGVISFLKTGYRKFWLHCKKTPKGIYKFKIRNA